MTISELIEHVGNENIEFQRLDQGRLDLNAGKHDGRITFWTGLDKVTDLMNGSNRFVGLVVWLPAERMPKTLTEGK